MRRRFARVRLFLELLLLLVLLPYAVLIYVFPSWAMRSLRDVAGARLSIGSIRLAPPCTIILTDVWLDKPTPGCAISSHRIVLQPVGISWRHRTILIRELKYEDLRLQFTRTREGTVVWPTMDWTSAETSSAATPAPGPPAHRTTEERASDWQWLIDRILIDRGTITFVDAELPEPFRGSLTDITLAAGPISFPLDPSRMSLAVQGLVVGHQDLEAPLSCSGWIGGDTASFDLACQLEALQLAAFLPYYPPRWQERLERATVKATSHLLAKDSQLEGRIQLQIGDLTDADLTFGRRRLIESQAAEEPFERVLVGELEIAGAVDRPAEWRISLAPGNDIARRLVRPLLARGRRRVPIQLGGQAVSVALTPATEAVMVSIEAAASAVREALTVLIPPEPEPAPAAAPQTTTSTEPADSLNASPTPAPVPEDAAPVASP